MIIERPGIVESIYRNPDNGTWTVKVKCGRFRMTYEGLTNKPMLTKGEQVEAGREISNLQNREKCVSVKRISEK